MNIFLFQFKGFVIINHVKAEFVLALKHHLKNVVIIKHSWKLFVRKSQMLKQISGFDCVFSVDE